MHGLTPRLRIQLVLAGAVGQKAREASRIIARHGRFCA
jgi:hypothetical protein